MKKPWSISTTVRNPERLRDFLRVLKKLEGQDFNKANQIKYQVLLIQDRLYKPLNIPSEFRKYYEDPNEANKEIPYEVAEEIFNHQNYKDPPMRGRQSVNPLNKLGFSIAREGYGPIKITELGNKFLASDYDIGYIFFKSLFKLQFPNPWSEDFSEKEGFNIMPFIAVMHLIEKINEKSQKKGLDRTEFSIFVPTLINYKRIDEQVEKIIAFRKAQDKNKYIREFAKDFYEIGNVPDEKINNLFDYGDNIMRYFRLTRYFKVSMDPFGSHWNIDLEPLRKDEIKQLLDMYSGEAIQFANLEDYLNHLSDIERPLLPWEKKENLEKIAESLKNTIINLIRKENLQIISDKEKILQADIKEMSKNQLENYISQLREFNLEVKERIKKIELMGDLNKIEEMIDILRDVKKLKEYKPEQFEKLIADAFKIINDEILIKPNYPKDDEGNPINHSPGNKPDIECYYKKFKAICEVTLNTSRLQWVQEGQPIMRHLRDFEVRYTSDEIFCIFVAPKIHKDTYSQFWISVKFGYDGSTQKIVPMTTEQFAVLLETLLNLLKQGKRFSHKELYDLYSAVVNESNNLNGFSEWADFINKALKDWQTSLLNKEQG
ncbi:AlwI family type II restriction endonuclease [Caldisericum sp.]|uniref:AlwI family type II restriction endonuclease n=1 Tax=Caldisericum sp. TaxID=2499687 RepID=UPI003D0F4245